MSHVSFENYSLVARNTSLQDTERAGRYAFQADAERRILTDLLSKLDLQPTDRLLEIGCGPGNLIIPLAHFVSQAVGIDNQAAIDRLQARAPLADNIGVIAGNFLTMQLPVERFEKVLIYSVLHYMSSSDEAFLLIDRALSMLAPGGRLLLGDIPNQDRKRRFRSSSIGRRTGQEWEEKLSTQGPHPFESLPPDLRLVEIGDELLLALVRHIRQQGHEAYLLRQDERLPFGYSREDIMVFSYD